MSASFASFDLFALFILFFSGVTALLRGFVREALTVTAFVAAALAALWARPVFADIASAFLPGGLIANLAALAFIFIIVYLAVSFVTVSLSKGVKRGEDVNVLDRTLGFVFGVARGLVLLGLLVLVFNNAAPGSQPGWLTGARVYPLAQATANLLQSLAPEGSWVQSEPARDDDIGDIIRSRPEDNG
ncbi:MAG: CvpA family protein [Pseudomonadota bacterium]